jgi:hypothetical protein
MVVPPTNGQSQPTQINVPATIAYKYPPFSPPEEGAWVMPPYLEIFPPANPGPLLPLFIMGRNMPGAVAYPTVIEPDVACLPPPVQTTEMFRGNQGWPL